jgi:hypothetical protein
MVGNIEGGLRARVAGRKNLWLAYSKKLFLPVVPGDSDRPMSGFP